MGGYKVEKITEAAGAIIAKAILILAFAQKFFTKNTPEAALLAAVLTAYLAAQSGVPIPVALGGVFTALVTYMLAEQASDAKKEAAIVAAKPSVVAPTA